MMAEDQMQGQQGGEDEVSLVDLLAALIRKRKLLFGFVLVGVVLSLMLFLGTRLSPRFKLPLSYTASVSALVVDPLVQGGPNDKNPASGNIAAAIATSGAAADLVGRSQGGAAASLYQSKASAQFDEKTAVLKIQMTASSSDEARALASAGAAATQTIFREVATRHFQPTPPPGSEEGENLALPLPEFKIIDSKVTPNYHAFYSVKLLVLICFAFLFCGILAAFAANAWDRLKEDPETVAKLRAAREGRGARL